MFGVELFWKKEQKFLTVEGVLQDVRCLVLQRPIDFNLARNLSRQYPKLGKIFEDGLKGYRRMAEARGDEFSGHIKGWHDGLGGEQKLVVVGNVCRCMYWRNFRQHDGSGVLNIDISGDIENPRVLAARITKTMITDKGEVLPLDKIDIVYDEAGQPKSVEIVKPGNPATDLKISF